MQRKRHLQILKMLKEARQSSATFSATWQTQIRKAFIDLEHAAFKARAISQTRSQTTKDQIKNFVKSQG
jgi:hypothetical protein